MHFLSNISHMVHDCTVALVSFLVLGSLTLVYVFFRIFEADIFSAD